MPVRSSFDSPSAVDESAGPQIHMFDEMRETLDTSTGSQIAGISVEK